MNFKNYKVGDLFDIHPTKSYKETNNKLFDNGMFPVITNTSFSNGVGGFSSFLPTEKGGIVTFSDTTSSDAIFYQPNDFIGYSHIQGLYPKIKGWNEKSLLYFVTLFKRCASGRFDYATKFTRKLANEMLIELPIKTKIVIDFDAISRGGGYENMNCRDFRIDDLFEVVGTKSLDAGKLDFVSNGINFVGRTEKNNGIQGKIQLQSFLPNEANTITCSVIGHKIAKYQEEPYYCSQNINKLIPKFKINADIAKYFITHIQKFLDIYNDQWDGYKLQDLKDCTISLPVTEVEEIDFKYMENYIAELEAERVAELDSYLEVTGLNNYELTTEELVALKRMREMMTSGNAGGGRI